MRTLSNILFFLLLSVSSYANGVVVNASYNDIRHFDEVVSLSPQLNDHQIELNDGEATVKFLGTRKVNATFLSLNKSIPKVTPKNFDWTMVGLFPIYSSYVKYDKTFDNSADFENFTAKIPREASQINDWKIGDSIYYNTIGGVGMFLSAGLGTVGLGPKVYVEGGYSVYVEKKSEAEVFVELRKVFTKSISLLSGTWGVFVEKAKAIEKTNGINFLIDLSTPKGVEVYEKLVRAGRADFAQQDTTGVVRVGDVTSKKVTDENKAAIVTPFIPFIELLSSRSVTFLNEHRTNKWDQVTDLTFIEHSRRGSHRFFKNKGEFTRSLNLVADANGDINSGSFTVFSKRNHFKSKSLKKMLKKVTRYTGLNYFTSKELLFDKQKLRYAHISASLELSEYTLKRFEKMMNKDGLKASVKAFKKYLKKKGFEKVHNIVKACGGKLSLLIEGQRITRSQQTTDYELTDSCKL